MATLLPPHRFQLHIHFILAVFYHKIFVSNTISLVTQSRLTRDRPVNTHLHYTCYLYVFVLGFGLIRLYRSASAFGRRHCRRSDKKMIRRFQCIANTFRTHQGRVYIYSSPYRVFLMFQCQYNCVYSIQRL